MCEAFTGFVDGHERLEDLIDPDITKSRLEVMRKMRTKRRSPMTDNDNFTSEDI